MSPPCKFRRVSARREKGKAGIFLVYSCRMGVQSGYLPVHCKDCSMRED